MTRAEGWTPERCLHLESRRDKAQKIADLLSSWQELKGARILDVGTGAGVAAAMLAELVGPQGRVTAVDVRDLRRVRDGFDFHLLDGVSLPFPKNSFDIAISNLVIEHVGGREKQLLHLQEIRRVLSDEGCAYVALPNRWAPVEPHFHVPFLTWLPQRWRSPYIRLTRQAGVYDCFPLSFSEATELFRRAGFGFTEHTYEAMQVMLRVEHPSTVTQMLLRTPRWLFTALHPLVPTFIFRLQPLEER